MLDTSRNITNDSPSAVVGQIADAVEAACRGAAAHIPSTVETALRRYASTMAILLPQQQVGHAAAYTRHLVYADPGGRFSIVALIWGPGHQTPVHAHYTWCAWRVLSGVLQEERYCWNAELGRPELRETVARRVGDTGYGHPGYEQIHRLGNAGPQRAISLHVYGIDAERVATHVNWLTNSG